MFVLQSDIQIGDYKFDHVIDVRIIKSVDLLSDTAVIKLPTVFTLKNTKVSQSTEGAIKPGDSVLITLGYKDVLFKTEFKGVVTSVKPNTPVEIHCEDAIWYLRRKTCNRNFKNTTLKDILDYIVSGTDLKVSEDVPEMAIDKFLLKNINAAQALQKLKDFGLSIYIDDNDELYAGLRQFQGVGDVAVYDLDYNVVSHDLEFKTADQVKTSLTAKSWKKDNTFIEVKVGDEDGQKSEWLTYGVSSKEELKKIALSKLESMKYDGYVGTLTGFGVPYITRGMSARLYDAEYESRTGDYFVPKVEISFGIRGSRRVVTVGKKVN